MISETSTADEIDSPVQLANATAERELTMDAEKRQGAVKEIALAAENDKTAPPQEEIKDKLEGVLKQLSPEAAGELVKMVRKDATITKSLGDIENNIEPIEAAVKAGREGASRPAGNEEEQAPKFEGVDPKFEAIARGAFDNARQEAVKGTGEKESGISVTGNDSGHDDRDDAGRQEHLTREFGRGDASKGIEENDRLRGVPEIVAGSDLNRFISSDILASLSRHDVSEAAPAHPGSDAMQKQTLSLFGKEKSDFSIADMTKFKDSKS